MRSSWRNHYNSLVTIDFFNIEKLLEIYKNFSLIYILGKEEFYYKEYREKWNVQ